MGLREFVPGDEVIGYIRQDILHHGVYAELVSAPSMMPPAAQLAPDGLDAVLDCVGKGVLHTTAN